MAGGVSKEALRSILIQAMCAAKSVRVQLDHLLQLRRRLQQRIHAAADDDDAAVVQEVAAGLSKVYFRGLEYASRYLKSLFHIAADNGARLDLEPAFSVIPDEQLYDVLLAQRLASRPTTQAQAFARIEAALYAVKLPQEHHIPRCIELLVGVRPPDPPRAAGSVDLDHALTYLHRACSLTSLAIKHIDLAVAVFSSFFGPKKLAHIAETAEEFCFIPEA
ncbi:uncharacterized protein LOC124664160 [Lolium rigidum]|uniref:uncharacterized protein LOC124664160 n=1 Tax=Lolium rigidum TaxID=89674 RepID=UPI001F5D4D55|nr:uncharacterized protein LOC124664160 [Lolium rigidum]